MKKRCICFCMFVALLVMGLTIGTKVKAMDVDDPFTAKITLDEKLMDDSTSIKGEIDSNTYDDIKVYVMINGSTYEGGVTEEYESWEFTAQLPDYFAAGTSYDVIVQNAQTGELVKSSFMVIHSDAEPGLKVNNITCSNCSVTGETVEDSKLSVKIGKKTYQGISDDYGNFSIKIPYTRIGRKYRVSVVSAINGNANSVEKIIKKPSTKLDIKAWLTVNTRKIHGKVSGAIKGDKILVKISGRVYRGKINVKKKTFTASIPRQKSGAKVSVILQNRFKQELKVYHDKIYLKNGFDVGMTEKQMRATTWGSPDEINYYNAGSSEQWIYYEDDETLYVYFNNGRLTDWQRVNS